MKTYAVKASEIEHSWWVVDATDKVLGVLAVHARTRREFTATEVSLLERTAPIVADILAAERTAASERAPA